MIDWLRTIAFRIVFYGLSVLVVLFVPVFALSGQRLLTWYVHLWTRLHRVTTRWILGITTCVEGDRPKPAIYAAKHQAMFETIELVLQLDGPAVVLKKELSDIPLWGWAARRYGMIAVDRDASSAAMRGMMRDAKAALAQGRSVLIFPEGTRVGPGEAPPLKPGLAGLYRILKLPIVPVALDTGRLLPRKGASHPGVVTFRFGETIPPGLPREEVEARVYEAMNALTGPPTG